MTTVNRYNVPVVYADITDTNKYTIAYVDLDKAPYKFIITPSKDIVPISDNLSSIVDFHRNISDFTHITDIVGNIFIATTPTYYDYPSISDFRKFKTSKVLSDSTTISTSGLVYLNQNYVDTSYFAQSQYPNPNTYIAVISTF